MNHRPTSAAPRRSLRFSPQHSQRVALICALAVGALVPPAIGDFIWDGDGDDAIFNDPLNWDGDVAPPFDLDGEAFIFEAVGVGGGQIRTTLDDDYFNIGEFLFDDTNFNTAFLGEGSFSFISGASIINDSTNSHQFQVDIIGTGSLLTLDAQRGSLAFEGDFDLSDSGGVRLDIRGDGSIRIAGDITGEGARIRKLGAGNLTLTGQNDFDGGVELRNGAIILGDDSALGTGLLEVTGDSSLESDEDDRSIDNDITIDDGVSLTFSGGNSLELTGDIVSGDDIIVDMDDLSTRVSFNNNNTDFDAGVILRRGRVAFRANFSLGSERMRVEGDGQLQALAENLSFNRPIRITGGNTLTAVGGLNMIITNEISGNGSFAINMNRTEDRVTILDANSYTGDTFLEKGTLVFGNDEALGEGELVLAGNGAIASNSSDRVVRTPIRLGDNRLTFRGDFDMEIRRLITGDGSLRIRSDPDATLTFSRTGHFTGGTEVDRGRLMLTGSLASDVEVNDRGILAGDGTINADLDVFAEGAVRPGIDDEPGTLTVDGDVDFRNNAELRVRLDDVEDVADLLDVSGAVRLRDGSRVIASLTSTGYLPAGRAFTIIDADGGITDEGAEIESDSATVTFRLDRDADFEDGDNEYAIEIVRDVDAYSAAAQGAANRAIGRSLDQLRFVADADPESGTGDFLAGLDALDDDGYNAALRQVSPARLAATDSLITDGARAFTSQQAAYLGARRAGFDRGFAQPIAPLPRPGSMASLQPSAIVLAQAIDEADNGPSNGGDEPLTPGRRLSGPRAGEAPENARHGAYFRIYGVRNRQDTTSTRIGFSAETFGGQVGYHYDVSEDFLLGVAIGYGNTSADYNAGLGTLDSNSIRVGPYASWSFGRFYVDASLTFAYHLFDADRAIPDLDLTATSDYDGYELTGYFGGGYSIPLENGFTLTPMASVQYSYFDIESFTETGAPGANLSVDGRSTDSLRTRIGLDLSFKAPLDLIPYAFLGWEHEFFDDDEELSASFIDGGPPFVVSYGAPGADRFFFGAGLNFLIEPGLIAYAHFENSIFEDGDIYAIAGGMRFNF